MITQKLSVVVPVFNSESTLTILVESALKLDFVGELILVDDGSSDGSWGQLQLLVQRHSGVVAIKLSRNFGQHNALLAGIRHAKHEVIATLDDDLQNPPEELPKLINALTEDVDVVYGLPIKKSESIARRIPSFLMKKSYGILLGVPSAPMISPFRVFRSSLREGFSSNGLGPNVSIDSLLSWSTTRFSSVRIEHRPRQIGKSNYSVAKLVRLALDTLTTYTTKPLRIASLVGAMIGLTTLVNHLLFRISPTNFQSPNVIPPILAILLIISTLSEYVARIHNRVMGKPSYVVASIIQGQA